MSKSNYETIRDLKEQADFWKKLCIILFLILIALFVAAALDFFEIKDRKYPSVPDEEKLVYDDETKVVYKLVPYEEDGYTYKYLDNELVLTIS